MRIVTSRIWAGLALAGFLLSVPSISSASCCQVGAGPCNIIPPLTHGQNGWTGAVCGTTLSGTNCTALLDADVTVTSGDCLTLGRGVTFDLAGKKIQCTSGGCGKAIINTDSAGSSNAVTIQNGDIIGPFSYGIQVTGGSNSSVNEILVDGADIGISGVRGPISDTVVRNSGTGGIDLYPGEDMDNVILRDNGVPTNGWGLKLTGNTANSDLDNVLFIGNYDNVYKLNASNTASLQRSEMQTAGSCNCHLVVTGFFDICYPLANGCFTITNSTTRTFVDDAMIP